jgi:hypothetical protein
MGDGQRACRNAASHSAVHGVDEQAPGRASIPARRDKREIRRNQRFNHSVAVDGLGEPANRVVAVREERRAPRTDSRFESAE